MSSAGSAVAHHFDDAEQQHDAASLGMWLFLVTEVLFFGGLFTAYVVYRSRFPDAFAEASHHLDIFWGTLNTAVLIGSSLTMALAVHGAQESRRTMLIACLGLTIVLGSVFLGVKGIEYTHKFHEHLIPGAHFVFDGAEPMHSQMFFVLYFCMTGLHALHMVIGIVILSILLIQSAMGMYDRHYYNPVEMTGLYWHFVDIVWIFLFPLLYLIGRH